jgi:hypothetical protein
VAEAINYGDARSAACTRGYCDCRAGQCPVLPLKLRWRDDSGGGNGGGSGGDDDNGGEGHRVALESSSSALRQWKVPSGRQDV